MVDWQSESDLDSIRNSCDVFLSINAFVDKKAHGKTTAIIITTINSILSSIPESSQAHSLDIGRGEHQGAQCLLPSGQQTVSIIVLKSVLKKINIVSTSAHLYLCHKSMKESSNIFERVLKNVSRNILNTLGSCGLGGPCILQLLYIPAWIRSMLMSWFLNKWE